MKTLIKNVEVIDGSGAPAFMSDVLIEESKIRKIALHIDDAVEKIIDGTNLSLSPGFVNTHSHSDLELFRNPKMEHVVRQGITTEIIGQDGSSVAPVHEGILAELADNMAPLAGVVDKPYWWRSFGEYLSEVEKSCESARIEGLIGHGTVRMCIMGNANRPPTQEELEQMKDLVAKSMDEGAKGISFGLIYPPGSYANTEEIVEICKVVASYDGIMMVHMRNEQDMLLESIDEMAYVARMSGVRLHISHLKALGYRNWGNGSKALEKLYELKREGIDVTFDQYPYTATCTGLKVVVPMWAYEGGEGGFQNRLENSPDYLKIADEVRGNIEARGGADKIFIASVASLKNKWMEGDNLLQIGKKLEMKPEVVALHILKVEGPSVVAIYFSISEDDVRVIMQSNLQCVCSDGITGATPHPRLYGAFPQVLGNYCKKENVLNLEEAIRKMTSEPARRLRLWDRGYIREGMSADLVLFSKDEIANTNSYENPKQFPKGILQVWVQGKTKMKEEEECH